MNAQGKLTLAQWIIVLIVGGPCLLGIAVLMFPTPPWSLCKDSINRACPITLHRLVYAQITDAQEYGGYLPDASRWCDLIRSYVGSSDNEPDSLVRQRYRCPAVPQERGFGYAMNVHLSRQNRYAIQDPFRTPLLYDSSNLAWNAHDPFTSLPNP
ncbi:MAG: hypothetical protein NZL85_04665, partial [Fimbriimonadales bacterium]|nr:hypothetical protein [Fimbriimonadales bacterium]